MGACLLGATSSARATTVVVANTHDAGSGSLRSAVDTATEGETIKVPKGVYRLTSGELSTDKSLKILGAGARKTILDGAASSRVIEDTATGEKLSLSDLTVRNGNSNGGEGGGIETAGALTLVRVAVTGNRAGAVNSEGSGGGVYASGALVVRSSLIARNYAYNGGAAEADSTLMLVNSTITHNSAGSPTVGDNGVSGAIETNDQPASVLSSTIAFNRCFNGSTCGGAFYNGDFVFTDSIMAENFGFENNGEPAGSAGNPGAQNNCDGPFATRYASAGYNLGGTERLRPDHVLRPGERQSASRQAERQRRTHRHPGARGAQPGDQPRQPAVARVRRHRLPRGRPAWRQAPPRPPLRHRCV